ncbi:MAG: sugar ABC transporter permease, partial [Candidatus Limiplasma sp.]|nr:sugar ABC transporter permease [Candidatus Limiplasma sp.]
GFVWRFIFQNLFPVLGELTGIAWLSQTWFSTGASSFWAMVIVMSWSMSGYMMIIYLAGLTSISEDYIEAATVDGAKQRHVLFQIVLPLIMHSITQCLFLSIVNCLRVYDLNISLTNGNPFRQSEAVTMNVYQTAFSSNQLGYGSAKALILVAIIALISILQVWYTSRKEVQQ